LIRLAVQRELPGLNGQLEAMPDPRREHPMNLKSALFNNKALRITLMDTMLRDILARFFLLMYSNKAPAPIAVDYKELATSCY
jgi:hypothetical protein